MSDIIKSVNIKQPPKPISECLQLNPEDQVSQPDYFTPQSINGHSFRDVSAETKAQVDSYISEVEWIKLGVPSDYYRRF
ncbi:MAG: hypothetical protein JXA24_07095 [Proteobacteria bacterium]|nr:hypothetical protein [Pseudomonadota bacterium]